MRVITFVHTHNLSLSHTKNTAKMLVTPQQGVISSLIVKRTQWETHTSELNYNFHYNSISCIQAPDRRATTGN
jgi:hypothetical protein